MKMTVKNVAKIREATIEINGITVIVGINNTGKSTISKSCYSILNSFYNAPLKIMREKRALISQLSNQIMNEIMDWEIVRKDLVPSFLNSSKVMRYANTLTREIIEKYLEEELTVEVINELIEKIYQVTEENDKLNSIIERIVEVMNLPDLQYMCNITQAQFTNEFTGQINTLGEDTTASVFLEYEDKLLEATFEENLLKSVTETKNIEYDPIYIDTPYVLDFKNRHSYRNNQQHHNKLVKLFEKNGAIEENAEQLKNRLQNAKKTKDILNNIIHGTIEEDDLDGITVSIEDKKIDLSNLAKGLTPFVIIKKLIDNGCINENTVLIIDEPEVHLHPEWQLKFAEILILLQKELNINILINTHSPYFLRAIQVYAGKNEIADKMKVYSMENDEKDMSISKDITGNTNVVFGKLTQPFIDLENKLYQ